MLHARRGARPTQSGCVSRTRRRGHRVTAYRPLFQSSCATDPGPSTSAAARAAATATTAPEPPAAQGMSSISDFHRGGVFLDGLHAHLTTRSGGNRGRDTARQMTRYVGKYLHYLNPDTVEEGRLLQTTPVITHLDALAAADIGSSGILHRILAHKVAVQYMRLGVNGP